MSSKNSWELDSVSRLFAIVSFIIAAGCTDKMRDHGTPIKITHPDSYQITETDVLKIVKLAHAVGIRRVAEIAPVKGDLHHGLVVTSPEIVNGRRKWHHELVIGDYLNIPVPQPEDGFLGAQLRPGLSFTTRHSAIFKINEKEIQIVCSEQTDLDAAARVFAAITSNALEFSGDDIQERNFNTDRPIEIAVDSNGVFIAFATSDLYCWTIIRAKLAGSTLVIQRSSMVRA